jgi:hypothetical protein
MVFTSKRALDVFRFKGAIFKEVIMKDPSGEESLIERRDRRLGEHTLSIDLK